MAGGPLKSKLPPYHGGVGGETDLDHPSSSSSSSNRLDKRMSKRMRSKRAQDEVRRVLSSKRAVVETDATMSAANFYIPTLPGLPSNSTLQMYGGHIPSLPQSTAATTKKLGTSSKDDPNENQVVDESDAHLYFFMIKARHIADRERTIFWFNGGPGCSSFDGSLMEAGPIRLIPGSKGQTLKEIDAAWNEYANVVFIDQPAGTGYSYVSTNKYVHELDEAANHVVEFLTRFYSVFPEFQRHDTYLAGESYAGQYIPYIARAILDSARINTPLKGVLIGNGWIDPASQYPAYFDFALQSGLIKKGTEIEKKVRNTVNHCLGKIETMGGVTKAKIHVGECENILAEITDSTVTNVNGQDVCVNNYDVRLTDQYPACGMNWPPDLADITPYLQREDVKRAFHASRHDGGWVECNGGVGANFWAINSVPAVQLFPKLLEEIPMLLFAGDQDLICNHLGIERLIEGLTWNGEKGFGDARTEDWSVNGKKAGEWTSARNLTYVKVAGASHMVPYDQPLASHDMVLRFLDVDLLGAAGSSARVPSRVGDEVEAVVGETKIDGTAVKTNPDGTIVEESGVKVEGSSSTANGVTDGSGGSSSSGVDLDKSKLLGGAAGALGSSSTVEGLVNVGSALVIITIMMLGFCLFLVVRRKMRRQFGSTINHGGASPGLGGRRKSLGRGAPSLSERTHEMDTLVTPNGLAAVEDEESGLGSSSSVARGRSPSEVFGVGDFDEEEELSTEVKRFRD